MDSVWFWLDDGRLFYVLLQNWWHRKGSHADKALSESGCGEAIVFQSHSHCLCPPPSLSAVTLDLTAVPGYWDSLSVAPCTLVTTCTLSELWLSLPCTFFFYIFPDPGWMVFKNNLICVEYVPQGWGLPQGNSRLLYLSERLCFTLTQDNKNRGQKKLKGSQTWLNISQKTVKIGQKNKWWWVEQKRPNINQNYVRNSYIKKLKMNQITKWYVGKWLKVKHWETRSNRSKIQLNTW